MNKFQNTKLSVAEALKAFFATNSTTTGGHTALVSKITELSNRITTITSLEAAQVVAITGVRSAKKDLRTDMINQALAIAGPLSAFARGVPNQTLLDEINFKKSDLDLPTENLCATRCQLIRDRANTNIAALGGYDITAAKLTALQTAITLFTAAIGTPQAASAPKKSATAGLVTAFAQLNLTFTDLDALMLAFRTANLSFYQAYLAAGKEQSTGSRKISLQGKITDSVTHTPIKNAAVVINGTNNKTETSKLGLYRFYSISEANVTITISATGYLPTTVTSIGIQAGKAAIKDVELAQIPQTSSSAI